MVIVLRCAYHFLSFSQSCFRKASYFAFIILSIIAIGKSIDWYLLGVCPPLLLYEMLVGIPPYYSNNKD